MADMRPVPVRLLEYGVITSQLLRIVNVLVHAAAMAAALDIDRTRLLIGPFANALVAIGLTLVITRGRFGVARWFLAVIIALDAVGLAGIPVVAKVIGLPFAIFSVIAILLMLAAAVLMFLPATSAWLKQDKAA
ncbi:MAG: hypothetical protein ACK4G2_05120 [Novosphingobium sp.]